MSFVDDSVTVSAGGQITSEATGYAVNTITVGARTFDTVEQARVAIAQAIIAGLQKTVQRDIAFALKTVALDTANMRGALENELQKQVKDQVRNIEAGQPVVISLSNSVIDGLVYYTKYHTRGHPDFNPNFAAGYKNPTTKGTQAIRRQEIINQIKLSIGKNVQYELRARGLR